MAGYAGASLLGESMHVDQLKRVRETAMGAERALRIESDAHAELLKRVHSAATREEREQQRALTATRDQREKALLAEVQERQAALREQDVLRAELGTQRRAADHMLDRERTAAEARAQQLYAFCSRRDAALQEQMGVLQAQDQKRLCGS